MGWAIGLGAVGLVAATLYWLLVTTEGVFLGRRVVVWLYDITADRYDAIKGYDANDERLLVVNPVLQAIRGRRAPLLLDVATGTGRVPYDLLHDSPFPGRVVALDASAAMLAIARDKLAPYRDRVDLLRAPAGRLPFPAACFDVITCLEALEFFPSDEAALREMARVLRPGGVLLTTRRSGRDAKLFLHHFRSEDNVKALLHDLGFEGVRTYLWQVNYDLVAARKAYRHTLYQS